MNAFCTIVDEHYVPFAKALSASIEQYDIKKQFFVLICNFEPKPEHEDGAGIQWMNLSDIMGSVLAKEIIHKYLHQSKKNELRWALKPVLIAWLLDNGLEKIIYTDCDIQFYSDYKFLFDELDKINVLLTPHWRSSDPLLDEFNFMQLYIYGLYNAGFVGVNSRSIEAMNWWARANLFICEVNSSKGQFVDQTHLNLLPVYFDGVEVLKHRGCNVAGWNLIECKRTLQENGSVLINDKWPVVFVHYSEATFYFIQHNQDPLLKPCLENYQMRVNNYAQKLGLKQLSLEQEKNNHSTTIKNQNNGFMYKIKNKLKSIIKGTNIL
jgi:hypothetical protein